jgi:XRE family aerobic/anaerobic benzoate catabolism transcriptional regulator
MPRRSSSRKQKKRKKQLRRGYSQVRALVAQPILFTLKNKGAAPRRKNAPATSTTHAYLQQLGDKIRSVRARRGITQTQLAKQCALSLRSLHSIEQGGASLSVARLHAIAHALEVPIESLAAEGLPASPAFEQSTVFLKKLPPADLQKAHKLLLEKFGGADTTLRSSRIALTGLRGAGKSTLGSLLAQILQCPFLELDKHIEADSGLTLTIIFDLYGIAGYRRMEGKALQRILARHRRFVLATGGSIVSDPAIYNRLLSECFTVWLRAKPEEHMARVLKQGDRRPIAQSRQAMRDLRRILWSREALYRQADATLETSGQSVKESLYSLARLIRSSH